MVILRLNKAELLASCCSPNATYCWKLNMQVMRMHQADLRENQRIVLCFQKHNVLYVGVGSNL